MRFAILLVVVAATGCSALRQGTMTADNLDAQSLADSHAALALKRGEAAEYEGKPEEAIRYYQQALSVDPQLGYLCRRVAVLCDQTGKDQQARAAYQQALQLEPNDPELLNDFGVFHLHREEWQVAEEWFRRSLAVEPAHQRAATNLAITLAMQNRLGESHETFSTIVGPAAAYSNIGVLLTRQGRKVEARQHFEQALAIDRTVHPAGEFLARLERDAEEQAAPDLDAAVQPASYQH